VSRLQTRLVRLEAAHQERLAIACKRLVQLLTDDELEAIVALADSPLTPQAEAAFNRIWRLATPQERQVLAAEPWRG
jgi:hypothetical protein